MTHTADHQPLPWFDAHLDLAYLAQGGRDMLAEPASAGGQDLPGCVTFPSLAQGGVKWALATLFTQTHAPGDPWGYGDSSDLPGAQTAAIAQLEQYHAWESQGHVRIIRRAEDLDSQPAPDAPLQIILLMENADPIGGSHDIAWWHQQGVRVVGMAWTHGSRYAGGNGQPSQTHPLTDAGVKLVGQMDELGIIHDLTHLNEASAIELLRIARGRVIATHSASRTLQQNAAIPVQGVDVAVVAQRHISDEQLALLKARGGMVGLPLYSRFVARTHGQPPDIARVIEHLQYLAERLGGWRYVGLGSDFDGGFSANDTPIGMQGPTQLHNLAAALHDQGHSGDAITGIAHHHWLRFFGEALAQ